MHVLFIEPSFPNNQREFVRALHSIGCRVTGIGERPYDWLDGELRYWLAAYERVSSVTDEQAVIEAVRRVQGREWVDRLEATVEAHILPIARVREACTIPGLSARTAYLCRDKVAMKDVLRRSGVPCAASAAISSPHVTPVHFYQPIPDTRSLPETLWNRPSKLVGIDMNEALQLDLLRKEFPKFRDEYSQLPTTPIGEAPRFYLNNSLFGGIDALVAYCMDDGVGFPNNPPDSKGLGLRLMRHGAALIGGTFKVRQNGQRGTIATCKVTVPDYNGLNLPR